MNFLTINYDQKCLPLIIKTSEQWNYLIHSSWITYSKTFISIDRNSTYIFNELFKFNNLTLLSNDLCVVIYRKDVNEIFYELIQCTEVYSPGYVLCAQKPFQSMYPHEQEFEMMYVIPDISNQIRSICVVLFERFLKYHRIILRLGISSFWK